MRILFGSDATAAGLQAGIPHVVAEAAAASAAAGNTNVVSNVIGNVADGMKNNPMITAGLLACGAGYGIYRVGRWAYRKFSSGDVTAAELTVTSKKK